MINNPFHILVLFLGLISLSLALVSKSALAKKISPVIIILFSAALVANLKIIPTESPLYDNLLSYAVPFAVCLILMHVRLSDIKKTGPSMLIAFAVASIGSTIGCIVAGILLNANLDAVLPGQGWKITGPYIGTYVGGSLNFVSMWSGLEIESPELFAAEPVQTGREHVGVAAVPGGLSPHLVREDVHDVGPRWFRAMSVGHGILSSSVTTQAW